MKFEILKAPSISGSFELNFAKKRQQIEKYTSIQYHFVICLLKGGSAKSVTGEPHPLLQRWIS